jgi:hypothetical protein
MLLLSGCRRDPHLQVYLDNVNAEKRLLEDTLYDLQYDYECSVQEVEKLRGEVTRLKTGSTGSDISHSAPSAGGKSKAKSPASSSDSLFPEIPDLKPPTVEPGTPAPPKVPSPQPKAPAAESPQDLDNLEPPVLDLGDEKHSASTTPKSSAHEAAQPAGGESRTAAARWTPRAPRPADARPRRTEIVDSPGPAAATANAPTGGAVSSQAQRPQWRPYR